MGALGSGNVQCGCPERRPGLAYSESRGHVAQDGNTEEGAQNRRLPGGAIPEPGERRQDEVPSCCKFYKNMAHVILLLGPRKGSMHVRGPKSYTS